MYFAIIGTFRDLHDNKTSISSQVCKINYPAIQQFSWFTAGFLCQNIFSVIVLSVSVLGVPVWTVVLVSAAVAIFYTSIVRMFLLPRLLTVLTTANKSHPSRHTLAVISLTCQCRMKFDSVDLKLHADIKFSPYLKAPTPLCVAGWPKSCGVVWYFFVLLHVRRNASRCRSGNYRLLKPWINVFSPNIQQ